MAFDVSAKDPKRIRRNWGKSSKQDSATNSLLLATPLAIDGSGSLSLALTSTGGLQSPSGTLGIKLNGGSLALAAGGISINLANSNTWTVTQHFAAADFTSVTISTGTATRVLFYGTAGIISGSADFVWDDSGKILTIAGSLVISTAGKGIKIKEGANATMGTATLVAGTVTVSTNKVTASSRVFLTVNGIGVLANSSAVYEDTASRSAGASFTIKALNVLSTDSVAWVILEPA